ncbi:cellulase family glycosylhydrolase, partial [bacterium]|nr:cellulase family glycosylhydrolase [bacterium]
MCLLLCHEYKPSHAHLITDGPLLLDANTHARVRLRCVNWYGAHQEPLVPGGLELTTVAAIANLIADGVGANCVRIPLADQTVLSNGAAVNPRFMSGAFDGNAMDVLDLAVGALTSRGLMVILNSHASVPGWVGSNEERPQGLWHHANVSVADWVSALTL